MSTQPTYRPDIDGLRALAVLAVVIFHAFPAVLPGGFIGVDVFFVISGFLISSIILKGLEQDAFSFTQFYAHRIRRIFPALILVLCTCFAVGWFALLPVEYKQLGKHIAGSSAFVSNWMFWREAGYFDNAADTKPLLHLWSLGIEEQFYIVWPVLVWGLFRWRLNILTFTIIALLASLAYSGVVISRPDLVKDFYSPLTRFWELLVGALLAYGATTSNLRFAKFKTRLQDGLSVLVFDGPIQNTAQRLRQLGSIIGLLLLIGGLILINQKTVFPGYWALLPTIGAVCSIGAGPHTWINRHLLSNRLLVGIGLISYPLYLWHWPLLSLTKIIEGEASSWQFKLLLMAAAVILSIATYWLIEKPIRFGKYQKVKTIILVLLMTIIGYMGYNTYVRDGLGFRFPKEIHQLLEFKYDFRSGWMEGECFLVNDQTFSDFKKCKFAAGDAGNAIYLWGDSHAASLSPGIRAGLSGNNYLLMRTASGCPPILDLPANQSPMSNCGFINKFVLKEIVQIKPHTVILSARWVDYLDWQNIRHTVVALNEAKIKNIILVGQFPLWKDSLPKLLVRYAQKSMAHTIPNRLEGDLKNNFELLALKKKFFDVDRDITDYFMSTSAIVVSPSDLFCNNQGCITMLSKEVRDTTAFDNGHITDSASKYFYENALKRYIN